MEHGRTRLVAAAAVIALCATLFLLGVFGQFNHRLSDTLYGGKQPLANIIVVGIDDKSLQEIGRWPWDRQNFSELISRMPDAQVIGVDIAFLERSTTASDAALGESLSNVSAVVVSEFTDFSASDNGVVGTKLLKPVPEITSPSGYANIVSDSDGIVRSLNLDLGDERAFSDQLYFRIMGKPYPKTSRFLINFVGPPGSFERVSASDVINGRIPAEKFSGKIVLIGAVANDFHDDAIVPTSDGKPMPGVEIHANALQTMITGRELHEFSPVLTVLFIILAVLLVAFLLWRLSAVIAGIISLAVGLIYIAAGNMMFSHGWLLNLIYIPLSMVIAFILIIGLDFINERMLKQKVMSAFGKYVSPDLLEQIMKKGVVLGGERKEITVLFSDIRGFTAISEKLTPEELIDFLNSYFTRVTKIIMDERGLVDKFIGDAIMAFWNAPLSEADHAQRSVITALQMRDSLDEIRKEHGDKYPRIEVGIGINTGHAVVGNVGSSERLSYTAIGDTVNLSSRLEGLTKEYGVQIIISEHTRRKVKGVVVRELDRVRVKGKKDAVRIYEVVGLTGTKEQLEHIQQYEQALAHYYKGEWKEAAAIFSTLNDAASKLLLRRCEEFILHPMHWDGAFEMTHK